MPIRICLTAEYGAPRPMKSDMNMPIAVSLTLLTTMHCSIPPCLAARRKATPETQRQSKIVGTKPGLQSRNSAKLVGIIVF